MVEELAIYEVNYNCKTSYPPFDNSNNSVYVKAYSREEAIKIAMNKMGFRRKELCFCSKIPTIN